MVNNLKTLRTHLNKCPVSWTDIRKYIGDYVGALSYERKNITLDGCFTLEELELIVDAMKTEGLEE